MAPALKQTGGEFCRFFVVGVGATLLPLQYVRSHSNDGSLALYTLQQSVRSRQPVVITRRGQYLSPYARYAIDVLTNKG